MDFDADPDWEWRTGALNAPTVRDILLDMIEEYARHTGHADVLRETVDGRVGEGAPADFVVEPHPPAVNRPATG